MINVKGVMVQVNSKSCEVLDRIYVVIQWEGTPIETIK